jgi:hypothetical protein
LESRKPLRVPNLRGRPTQEWCSVYSQGLNKYTSTGDWGFAQFDDGKPAKEVVHKICFPSHETVKARDFVSNRYSP